MEALIDPRNISPSEFFEKSLNRGLRSEHARRLFATVVGRGSYAVAEWVGGEILPKRLSGQFSDLPELELLRTVTSPIDGFTKLAFRTADGFIIESVLIPLLKEGCYSVCLSSQVGCPMACAFCATGRMTTRRNLDSWEIVDQFIQAKRLAKERGGRVTGAVFMGMGEPFLNYKNVINAADVLRYPADGAIRGKAITISTVGLVPEINRFTDEEWPFRLSISIGAASDEKRALLLPVASRFSAAEVMAAARRHALDRRDRVMISYVCISGLNVSEDDARTLGELIGDTPVRLDLIDVTDPTGTFLPPGEQELKQFRDALTKYVKQPVVRRYSGGKDISAACGTLAGNAYALST